MPNPSRFSVQEDICLGHALRHFGLTFTGPKFTLLQASIANVREIFVRAAAKLGIDGSVRTFRSLIVRVRRLRRYFRTGQLSFDPEQRNSLEEKRFALFSQIFKGDGHSCVVGPRAAHHAPRARQALLHHRGETKEKDRKLIIPRDSLEGKIHKDRHLEASRVLHALNRIQKHRSSIMLKREENDRELLEMFQRERRWKRDMVQNALKISRPSDGMWPEFLQTLEDISVSDTKLCLAREDKIRAQIRSDREYFEWERSRFEELIKRYFDEVMNAN